MEKNFETEVLNRLTAIETKLDDYKTIRSKAETADYRSTENEKDIKEIQEKIKWLSRAITTAIITGIVGIVFIYIKIGLGIG